MGGGHGQVTGPLVAAGHPVSVLGRDASCEARVREWIPPDNTTYEGLGAYAHNRIWQVYLLDGITRWQYVGPVVESFSPPPGGCNLTVSTRTAQTNNVGRFTDCYGTLCLPNLPPIPACAVNPNCTTSKTQTISVMGVPFAHTVTFGCTDASISRP